MRIQMLLTELSLRSRRTFSARTFTTALVYQEVQLNFVFFVS